MSNREIIVVDDEAGHAGQVVTREPAPETDIVFAGTGPARGEYEASVEVEYLAPRRAA